MKMAALEKRLVNAKGHSRAVATRAVQRLGGLGIEPAWTYLDVGCGNGVATLHVADTFELSVVGVDVDPEQIRFARQTAAGRRDAVFLHADATHLPFENGRFNIVATNKTTHHIPRWPQALGEMDRVLKQGGYWIYSDLALPAWIATHLKSFLGDRAGVFTSEDLNRAFAALGFRIVHKTTRWHSYEAVFVKRGARSPLFNEREEVHSD